MSHSATATFAPASFGRAAARFERTAPRLQPAAIAAARARNNAAELVVRSQFAAKPAAIVMAEGAVVLISAAAALFLALGL